jgi:UDP-N-acetylmuramoyl-L-alanyl-D-glutamate--2,6-diaminopimelate ligase
VFLTTDDPGFEDPADIAAEINRGIDHEQVRVTTELDRPKAIHDAILDSNPGDIVVVAGKGADPYQKVRGVDTPYPTDMVIVRQVIDQLPAAKGADK